MSSVIISSAATPIASTIGGFLIGTSASTNMLGNGRITGISSIFSGAIFTASLDSAWKASFLSGMLVAAAAQAAFFPRVFGSLAATPAASAVAGALVGFGTSMGSGCTSGHGVCGLPRLSARSWVAVSTFIPVGILTASAIQATPWLKDLIFGPDEAVLASEETLHAMPLISLAAGVALLLEAVSRTTRHKKAGGKADKDLAETATDSKKEHDHHHHNTANPLNIGLAWGVGACFSAALGLSGMANPDKVLGFLAPMRKGGWDPSLVFVLLGAICTNAITFPLMFTYAKPILAPHWHLPTAKDITPSLVIGSAIFGVGWGIAGMCPGPAIVSLASGGSHALAAVSAMAGGMAVHRWIKAMGWA